MIAAFTAIVTGASEGLGKSFALELASRKINLVLVALKETGLPQLANYIRKNFDVAVTILEADLTQLASCTSLFDLLSARQIMANILVNNAGIGNLSFFEEKDTCFYQNQITLNAITPVWMIRLFLKQAGEQNHRYILNVGSLGSRYLVPQKQVYGATKSFISYFTRCLRVELTGSNVSISLLSPGGINTRPELLVSNQQLKGVAKATITEAGRVAYEGISGMLRRKKEIIPGNINKLIVALTRFIPGYLQDLIIKKRLSPMLQLKLSCPENILLPKIKTEAHVTIEARALKEQPSLL